MGQAGVNGKAPFGGRKVFIGGTADKDHDELLRHFSHFGEVSRPASPWVSAGARGLGCEAGRAAWVIPAVLTARACGAGGERRGAQGARRLLPRYPPIAHNTLLVAAPTAVSRTRGARASHTLAISRRLLPPSSPPFLGARRSYPTHASRPRLAHERRGGGWRGRCGELVSRRARGPGTVSAFLGP